MDCPYKDSLIPRCDIWMHPHRQDIEYCRICGEWRNINDVGNPIAQIIVIAVMAAIVLMVAQNAMEPEPATRPLFPNNQQAQSLEVVPSVVPFL